jgi:AraC family transcriptional regulator of adaptative response/methylated-DNA-[protein]-cysteine methyltransferase
MSIQFGFISSSFGLILLGKSSSGIVALLLGDNETVLIEELQEKFPSNQLIESTHTLKEELEHAAHFIENPHQGFHLPLDMRGTPFQKQVWQALKTIPFGQTSTYGHIAKQLGNPKSFRAVGSACALNHFAILIPCHRILRKDGDLSGFRWGIERKRALLAREGVFPQAQQLLLQHA